jgi:hypothetical protein
MNLLEKLERWKSSAFRVALYTLPLIAAGVIFDSSLVADAGWLTSSILLVAWAAMSIVSKLLSPRIPTRWLRTTHSISRGLSNRPCLLFALGVAVRLRIQH